jgi:hypothetical protein
MIPVTDEGDVFMAERFRNRDPFQMALPCWLNQTLHLLPHESINVRPTLDQMIQRDKEIMRLMAIRMVAENDAPQRLHGRGVISSSQEYLDALTAVRNIKQGQAIVVTIESPELLKKEKPEIAFAYAVRRYLAVNGIMATAYASAKGEVVIRRSVAPPKNKDNNKK